MNTTGNQPSDAAGVTQISDSILSRFPRVLHMDRPIPAITSDRFIVRESYGYGHRGGIRILETSAPRELAQSTVNGYIRELKNWAGGYADHVTDVESAGWRLITAHHWINGFENIHVLHVQKSTVYNRIQAGME